MTLYSRLYNVLKRDAAPFSILHHRRFIERVIKDRINDRELLFFSPLFVSLRPRRTRWMRFGIVVRYAVGQCCDAVWSTAWRGVELFNVLSCSVVNETLFRETQAHTGYVFTTVEYLHIKRIIRQFVISISAVGKVAQIIECFVFVLFFGFFFFFYEDEFIRFIFCRCF